MLAGQQSALAVAVIPVAVVRGSAENTNLSGLLMPTQHAVVGDVAEQQITPIPKPDRSLRPSRTGVEALDRSVGHFVFRETRINHFHGSIGIGHRIFLLLFHSKAERIKGKRRCKPGSQVHKCPPLHVSSSESKSGREHLITAYAAQRKVLRGT